jgi:nucleotide-binding universal stress UspA family protein
MMIRKILCAIDRSPSSLQALGYAIALARWQSARLNLLEVVEEAPPPGVSRAPKSDGVPNETRTALERDLRRVLTARRASDVKVQILMRKGKVVQEILAQANASRSDLVVIGSHGRGGVQRLVLGSIAEKVLRLATCPVLTVRRGVRLARRSRSPFETILCPTDFSAAANRAVAYAKRLAREADAKLILMSAVEWPFDEAVMPGAVAELRKSIESNATEALTRLLPRSASHGPPAQAIVAVGKASATIVKVARARSVDLIVMGVSGRGALDMALLGSTTHHVIREGASPVLTVRAVTR